MHTKFWLEKPGAKRPLGRPKYRLKENIKMDLKVIDCGLGSTGSI
jgi:hypothetical protein